MSKQKGSIFVSIFITLALYLFAIMVVVVFFMFFKYHVTIIMWDEYRWNKVQEVPLSLLSMDVDGGSFVTRMNKVYYGHEDKDQFRDRIDGIVKNQLAPIGWASVKADIKIDGIKITRKIPCTINVPGCEIEEIVIDSSRSECYCSAGCPGGRRLIGVFLSCAYFDICDCVPGAQPITYSARYPFPLTFDGTNKFIDEISYHVVEG